MGISLKKAASQMLKWNIKGQKVATARHGHWIQLNDNNRKRCTACKIGMVMIGRYGLSQATTAYGTEKIGRLQDTLNYGPMTTCPIRGCAMETFIHSTILGKDQPLGIIVEHLFEEHRRSVMWIDKWLAGLAGEKLHA